MFRNPQQRIGYRAMSHRPLNGMMSIQAIQKQTVITHGDTTKSPTPMKNRIKVLNPNGPNPLRFLMPDFKDPLEMDPSTVDTQDSWTEETEETDEWNSEDSEAGSWDLRDSNQERRRQIPQGESFILASRGTSKRRWNMGGRAKAGQFATGMEYSF